MITSLDGYTADAQGDIGWGAPDADVFECVNALERTIGTYLLGRRMYETMLYWETFEATDDQPVVVREFASLWHAAEKVVFSRTLGEPSSAHTRIEREFHPATVCQLKESSGRDLSIAGPELAGQAIAAGLVDEIHLFMTPITLGGGTPALPSGFRADLQLIGLDRFDRGVVHLHYRLRP
jgi:dihydrofolate reductase